MSVREIALTFVFVQVSQRVRPGNFKYYSNNKRFLIRVELTRNLLKRVKITNLVNE